MVVAVVVNESNQRLLLNPVVIMRSRMSMSVRESVSMRVSMRVSMSVRV